jgi:hypothetical protein
MPEKIGLVSEFIENLCQVSPQISEGELMRYIVALSSVNATLAGSFSDLFIKPMLPCMRDVDVMLQVKIHLAVPSRRQMPQRLPPDFDEPRISVFEIVDTAFPGYVRLLYIGELREVSFADFHHTLIYSTETQRFLDTKDYVRLPDDSFSIRGPARTKSCDMRKIALWQDVQNFDLVHCVRCFDWPVQAAKWRLRRRPGDWPDEVIISQVVNSGCDLVPVAHRRCRQNTSLAKYQWRLSFSRAETVLLNSWTPKQQIVYHILRIVIRESGLTEILDNMGYSILSRYHLKTQMLWTCEREHSSWWSRSNIIELCRNALQTLLQCCTTLSCAGYFIIEMNLFEDVIPERITCHLERFTNLTYLTEWLIDNYIGKCALRCSTVIQQQFDDNRQDKLDAAMKAIVDFKRASALSLSFAHTSNVINETCAGFKAHMCRNVSRVFKQMKQLQRIDQRLKPAYSLALCCLSLLSAIDSGENDDDIVDVLTAVLTGLDASGTLSVLEQRSTEYNNRHVLSNAISLLQLGAMTSNVNVRSISLRLAHINLRRALLRTCDDNENVECLVNVSLGVLYFTKGQRTEAVKQCKLALSSCGYECPQDRICVVERTCLSKISGDVNAALGLSLVYMYVLQNATSQRSQTYSDDRPTFTALPFAHYLAVLSHCAEAQRWGRHRLAGVQQYRKCFHKMSRLYPGDLILFYITVKKQVTNNEIRETESVRFNDQTELQQLLLELSLENLTLFQEILSQDYESLCKIATTDLQAMYAYKCRMFEECLQISVQNLNNLWLEKISFPMPIVGCFVHLWDDIMVSLAAVGYLNSVNELDAKVSQRTISIYLTVSSRMQLQHSSAALLQDLRRIRDLHKQTNKLLPFDCLLLSLIYRKAIIYIEKSCHL